MSYDRKREIFKCNCDHVGQLLYLIGSSSVCSGCGKKLTEDQLTAKIQKDLFSVKQLSESISHED